MTIAAPPPATLAASRPAAAAPAPAPAGEVVLTLSVLAALLAEPGDPSAAGSLAAPVRAALAGPLGRLVADDEQGWQLSDGAVLRAAPGRPDGQAAEVTAPVATTLLGPKGHGDDTADGWRLPGRG